MMLSACESVHMTALGRSACHASPRQQLHPDEGAGLRPLDFQRFIGGLAVPGEISTRDIEQAWSNISCMRCLSRSAGAARSGSVTEFDRYANRVHLQRRPARIFLSREIEIGQNTTAD